MPLVSIIIRTKNEERWISDCLRGVSLQEFKDYEIIVVDNNSEDTTLDHVRRYNVKKILHCSEYLPGKALNIGIDIAEGQYIACLSGHCIPTNSSWLGNLLRNFDSPEIAGVYGRQQPLSFTSPSDKRDLLIVFGPERRIQRKDSFFHNANSMVRRDVLNKIPFDHKVTNIEDRLWAQEVQNQDYCVVYEPEASVYHYHGIHQGQDEERCHNVVRILESLSDNKIVETLSIRNAKSIAIIPLKGKAPEFRGINLLETTIKTAKNAECVNLVVVSADTQEAINQALKFGCDVGILRGEELSQSYITLEDVYKYTLERLSAMSYQGDVVILLEVKYPFRPKTLIDDMFSALILQNADTVIPGRKEANSIWIEESENTFEQIDEGLVPKKYKKSLYIGHKGLCCVTWPGLIKSDRIFSNNLHILPLRDPFAFIEATEEECLQIPELLSNT